MKSNSFDYYSNLPTRSGCHYKDKPFVKEQLSTLQLCDSQIDLSTSCDMLSNEERFRSPESQGQENVYSNLRSMDQFCSSYNTLIIHGEDDEEEDPWSSSMRDHPDELNRGGVYSISGCCDQKTIIKRNSTTSPINGTSPTFLKNNHRNSLELKKTLDYSLHDIRDIPDEYLNKSCVLKHLVKEACGHGLQSHSNARDSGVSENLILDIERLSSNMNSRISEKHRNDWHDKIASVSVNRENTTKFRDDIMSHSRSNLCFSPDSKLGQDDDDGNNQIMWQTNDMIEILIKENCALKLEIENSGAKIAKTQTLEEEIEKIQKSYEDLVQSSERREQLETTIRNRLQTDCKRLQDLNKALKEQVDLLSSQLIGSKGSIDDLAGPDDLNKRDSLITQLQLENKDLKCSRERLESELNSHESIIQEQKNHIEILESALANIQLKNIHLEDECRKKQVFVERINQLQEIVSSLHLSANSNEPEELQNEPELKNTTFSEIKQKFRNKNDLINYVQNECSKWDRSSLENNVSRKAQLTTFNERTADEPYYTRKQLLDMETRVKNLEETLAEKDSLICGLQKSPFSNKLYQGGISRLPNNNQLSIIHKNFYEKNTASREDLLKSLLNNSTGLGSTDSSPYVQLLNQTSYDVTKKALDADLKNLDNKLDSQLVNKPKGLCCFPRLSNTTSNPKKGKIPEPLNSNLNERKSCVSNLTQPKIHEQSSDEIILLEQQGRSSQKQRKSNKEIDEKTNLIDHESSNDQYQPPSSLPRLTPKLIKNTYRLVDSTNLKLPTVTSKSMIPSPKKCGQYSRLVEPTTSTLKKPTDIHSASKIRLLKSSTNTKDVQVHRGKKTCSIAAKSISKYRIQF